MLRPAGARAQSMLALEWREWMTRRVTGEYLANRAFYQVQAGALVDNPDQRIASDARCAHAPHPCTHVPGAASLQRMGSWVRLFVWDCMGNPTNPGATMPCHGSPGEKEAFCCRCGSESTCASALLRAMRQRSVADSRGGRAGAGSSRRPRWASA